MRELSKHVEESIRVRRLLRRGQAVLVAVSGGVDSMVLLHVLHELSRAWRWRLTVAHLNHQLRGNSSEADARLVVRAAKSLQLPIIVKRANVRNFARAHKISLEMAARKLRHEFLARTASRLGIPVIALAHHADDQVELFFLRLFRGAGSEGLAGMKWRQPSPSHSKVLLVRPLLDQAKAMLREYVVGEKIRFREDATNTCLNIQRNRIRHELLPLLRRNYQPALDQTILRAMEIIGAEGDFVTRAVRYWLDGSDPERPASRGRSRLIRRSTTAQNSPKVAIEKPDPTRLLLKGAEFDDLPLAIQRRSLHLQVLAHGVTPNFDLIEELRLNPERSVSTGVPVDSESSSGPRKSAGPRIPNSSSRAHFYFVRDSAGKVHFRREKAAQFDSNSVAVDLRDRASGLLFDRVRIFWRLAPGKFLGLPSKQAGAEFFDADKVGSRILLRHWQPGDRFQPIGMKTPVKLQNLFTNARIVLSRRRELILGLTDDGDIFWVEGLRISERYKLSKTTIRRLHWRWHRL